MYGKWSSRSLAIAHWPFGFLFQESTEMDDDANEGEESTELPLDEAETTTPTEKTDTESDVDEDDTTESDEGVFEPRGFPLGPEEEEAVDDQVVIEAKDNSGGHGQVSFGIPPSSFWLWNGAPVFNPFVDNAIDREESEGTDSVETESEVAEPVQQTRDILKLIKFKLRNLVTFMANFVLPIMSWIMSNAKTPLPITQPAGLLSTVDHGKSTHGRILLFGRVRR